MQFKIGDLVHVRVHTRTNQIRKDNEIWLVLGKGFDRVGGFTGYVRVQNVHSGEKVQYNESMLMKIETDKK